MIDINVHDDKQERLYGGYNDRLRRGFLLLPQLSEQEGGVSRILVTDLFDEPCQSEETDHFFIRSSVNYRTNEELSEVIE